MKVRAIKDFYDLVRQTSVKTGDEFEVDEVRGKALTSVNNNAGYTLCEPVTTPTTEKVATKKPRAKKEV